MDIRRTAAETLSSEVYTSSTQLTLRFIADPSYIHTILIQIPASSIKDPYPFSFYHIHI